MKKDNFYFDPKPTRYPFPLDTASHYIKLKKQKKVILDDKYPYIDRSSSLLIKQFLIRIVIRLIVFPICRIRLGLKVKGRRYIRKNKKILKQGVISCCNHVNYWDYLCILDAIRPFKPYYLVWDKNIRSENGTLIKLTRGVPIPDTIIGTKVLIKTIDEYLLSGGWVHVYPEGSMWEFYKPIRPFKRGLSHFAIKANKPILPLAISYRKPNWIRKNIFHQQASLTIHIGKLIYLNDSLESDKQEEDLLIRVHKEVCNLAGIENNIYEPIYDNSKRIDYYN